MKALKLTLLSTFFFLFLIQSPLIAQDKVDVLILNNGETKEGKVTGITDSIIKFRYVGEDFDYEIQKSDVAQIKFASGRIESFGSNPSKVPTDGSHAGSHPDRHNKIAVLPFAIITNDAGLTVDELRNFTQNQAANTVRNEYKTLTLQDPLTTNAILAKAGINQDNMDSYTPAELAELLEVEFVIFGAVKVTTKGAVSSTYGSSSYNQKSNSSSKKGTIFSSSSSTTTIEYDTMVDLRMFNDRGDNLYSNSRHAFGTGTEAYKGSVDYMLRRTPFGSKYGKK
ncbi:hypothetical protein E4S40_00500 [Algoriphagus kandeliae]|uniref:DUF481 domain-containing protein n=1 Tax=Algoriphagus kandeliae TaxID=2562278 RepID=A0A4Y9QXV6_9BACT|nr:hypothetical protein [Algoriphagus kandeliae]TFV97169.1 hypothetical protein E4S40_00500 [Algoriphagus kandeliae]